MRLNVYGLVAVGVLATATDWQTVNVCAAPPSAEGSQADDRKAEAARFETVAQRYWKILQKRPRRGTAFDLWYRHYLDGGKLDELVELVQRFAGENADSSVAKLLLGLVYERQGRDDEAVAAFTAAQRLAPGDFYPVYLRGMLQARKFEFDAAAVALSEAIALNPSRIELLELYKKLGRIQLRQGQTSEALATWSKLADKFPKDHRVLTELAQLLAREEQFEPAIQRWEQVAALAKRDPYRQLQARVEIAQLHAHNGKVKTAVSLFDRALEQLKPDSWMAEDIRRRIRESFLAQDDFSGLIAYCNKRLKRHPEDLNAMLQLARALAQSGQRDRALSRYRTAVKLAPSRRDIREALIQELARGGRFSEAIDQCRQLAQKHPSDVEVLRLYGEMHLQAVSGENRTEDKRRDAELQAAEIWKRIAAIRPNDATLAVQVAEACRRAAHISSRYSPFSFRPVEPTDPRSGSTSPLLKTAEEYYREAIRRAPGVAQYHEYLGEFLHATGRRTEAVAAWSQLVRPPNDTAAGWHRLAEVYAGFDYLDEALAAGEKSLTREPDRFGFHEFQIDLLDRSQDYDKALEHLSHLDRLADGPIEEEKALRQRVEVYAASGRSDREIERLQSLLKQDKGSLRDDWTLGLLLADRWRFGEAADSLAAALKHRPDDVRLLKDHAVVLERSGNLAEAAEQYQRLIKLETKNRAPLYEKLVHLQLQQGHTEKAKQAAARMVSDSLNNLDSYLLKAAVFFRLDEVENGLATLRRAVQIEPRDIHIRSQLARSLAEHGRSKEAMEHYWRCFELAGDLDEKLSLVASMTELAKNTGSDEELVDQLRRLRQRQEEPKTLTLCVVEALRLRKKYPEARRELTDLLASRPDDVDVLNQLAELAATTSDWETALVYQEKVVSMVGNRASLNTLANYYTQKGDDEGAAKVWQRIMLETGDDTAVVSAVDRRIRKGAFAEAKTLIEWALAIEPKSWKLLYRAGYCNFALRNYDTAFQQFEQFLAVAEDSGSGKFTQRRRRRRGYSSRSTTRVPTMPRQVVTRTSSGQRIVTYTSTSVSQNPAFQELYAARLTYLRLINLPKLPRISSNSRAISKSVRSKLNAAIRLPSNRQSAVNDATVALYKLARKQGRERVWLETMRKAGRENPARLRSLILVYAGTGQLHQHDEILNQLVTLAPDDSLPHLARFYQTTNKSIGTASLSLTKLKLESMRRSFDWISLHRPNLRRDVIYNYGTQLISLGAIDKAAQLVSDELASVRQLGDLGNLPPLAFQISVPSFRGKFLSRVSKLAANSTGPAALKQLQVILQLALNQNFSRLSTDEELNATFALFERHMILSKRHMILSKRTVRWSSAFRATTPRTSLIFQKKSTIRSATRSPRTSSGISSSGISFSGISLAQNRAMLLQQQAFMQQQQQILVVVQTQQKLIRELEVKLLAEQKKLAQLQQQGDQAKQQIRAAQQMIAHQKELLAVSNQRQAGLMSQLKAYSRRVLRVRAQVFPGPTDYLTAESLLLLQQLHSKLAGVVKSALLTQRLADRSVNSTGEDQRTYRMAHICVLWWAGQKSQAVDALQKLAADVPDANKPMLRLNLAQAYYSETELSKAYAILNRIGSDAPPDGLRLQIDSLRSAINQALLKSTDAQIFESLLVELTETEKPQLGFFFDVPPAGRRTSSRSTRNPFNIGSSAGQVSGAFRSGGTRLAATRRTNSQRPTSSGQTSKVISNARPAPSSRTSSPASTSGQTSKLLLASGSNNMPLVRALNHARKQDLLAIGDRHHLEELEQAALAQLKKHPAELRLKALLAVVRFKSENMTGALQSARQWFEEAQSKPSALSSSEAILILSKSLKHAETRSLGRQLAVRFFGLSESRLGTNVLNALVTEWTDSLVKDGRTGEAEKLVRGLFTSADRISVSKLDGGPAIYNMAQLAQSFHPALLPVVLDELSKRVVKQVDKLKTNVVAWLLYAALTEATPKLSDSDRKRMLESLLAMLFPTGTDKDAELYRWSAGSTSLQSGSLGMLVIDLAKVTGDLSRLSKEWSQHPLADSMNLLALRAEAAVAAGEKQSGDKLIQQIEALHQRTGLRPPVWSLRVQLSIFPDRTAAEWVLSLGNGAFVNISPGGNVGSPADLPKTSFILRKIDLFRNPKVTDAGLAYLSQLYQLQTLRLSYTPTSDAGLEHLVGLKNLQTLSLNGTKVTDAGIEHLKQLPKLKLLFLENVAISKSAIQKLKAALPNCEIEH